MANTVLKLIANDGFIAVNKHLIKSLGLECAVLIGELASEAVNNDSEDGFFYATVEKVKDNTGLSEYQQKHAIEKLKKAGIVETKVAGLPAKRFFRINEEAIVNLLESNSGTSSVETEELDNEKLRNCSLYTNSALKKKPDIIKKEKDTIVSKKKAKNDSQIKSKYPDSVEKIMEIARQHCIRITREQAEAYFNFRVSRDWVPHGAR